MHNKRSLRPIVARSGLTAAVALLAALSQAQAQAPAPGAPLSGAGSFPQSFIVPGTNTSLHVGGFLQMDVIHDMSAFSGPSNSPGAIDNLAPMSVELSGPGTNAAPFTTAHTNHGVFRGSVQNSRFYVETRTPTAYGEVKTYFEVDGAGSHSTDGVNGAANAAAGTTQTNFNLQSMVRLRQAYGTLGPWLFGQTNSNYADLGALADTLDAFVAAGIASGAGNVRVPQVRYTYLLPAGINISSSLEMFETGGLVATAAGATATAFNDFNSPGIVDKYPALTASANISQPWGHAAFHMAVAESRFKSLGGASFGGLTGALPIGAHVSRWGYQLSQTGHFNTIGKDKITWNLSYGQGAAQYNWALNELGAQWVEDLICTVNGPTLACSQPRNMGVNTGYSHYWTDEWRTGIAFGYDQVSRPNGAATWGQGAGTTAAGITNGNGLVQLERKHYSAEINVLWTPVRGAQLGLEYEWYHRTVWSGAHGSANRVKFQTLFAF